MRIFISRALTDKSPFGSMLQQYTLQGLSLIDFEPIAFESPVEVDWLFFYSKNGIKYFFEQQPKLTQLPLIGVIGSASARYLDQRYGIKADFIGTGAPETTAEQFLAVAQTKNIVFVQAQNSKQSIQKLLGEAVLSQNLIVYNNYPKRDFEIATADILVFTSPMNVTAYFSRYVLQPFQQIVSIGKTTAAALEQQGMTNYFIAASPNEKGLATTCLNLINNKL